MKLTTTFSLLRQHSACQSGYRKLAKYLGGIKAYGADTPIDLITVLDSNGYADCVWCLRATQEDSREIAKQLANALADAAVREAMKVCDDPAWLSWAEKWLDGTDRSEEAARTAWTAAWVTARATAEAAVWAAVWAAETAEAAVWAAVWAAETAEAAARATAETTAKNNVDIDLIIREHLV